MLSEALAQRLRLPRQRTSFAVYGIGGSRSVISRGRVQLKVFSRTGEHSVGVSALILPRLTIYTGGKGASPRRWKHLQGIDPAYNANDPIELLLGAEVYATILVDGLRRASPSRNAPPSGGFYRAVWSRRPCRTALILTNASWTSRCPRQ